VDNFLIQNFAFFPSANFRQLKTKYQVYSCSSSLPPNPGLYKTSTFEQILDFMVKFWALGFEWWLKRTPSQQQESKSCKQRQCRLCVLQSLSQDSEGEATKMMWENCLRCNSRLDFSPYLKLRQLQGFPNWLPIVRADCNTDETAWRGYSSKSFDTEYSGTPNILHCLDEKGLATQHHLLISYYPENAHVSGKFPAGRWDGLLSIGAAQGNGNKDLDGSQDL